MDISIILVSKRLLLNYHKIIQKLKNMFHTKQYFILYKKFVISCQPMDNILQVKV
jgi:hypothetical protein